MRTINQAGLDLIRDSEGCKLRTYLCPAGIKTIGYGHTGPDVKLGQTITLDKAGELLAADLQNFEAGVAKLCPVTTGNQFSALVSFAYNLGLGSLQTSTLRRMHNEGHYDMAQAQFARWCKAGGRTLPGLVKRRAKEAALYGGAA